MNFKIGSLLIVLAAFAVSCDRTVGHAQKSNTDAAVYAEPVRTPLPVNSLAAPILPVAAKMVFRYEYANYAWRYAHFGWYIDQNGDIYTFAYEKPGLHGKSASFKERPTLFKQISLELLEEKTRLIEQAASGKITEESRGADQGSRVFTAFLSGEGMPKAVKLGEFGDWERVNQSPEAKELVEWLRSIDEEISIARRNKLSGNVNNAATGQNSNTDL